MEGKARNWERNLIRHAFEFNVRILQKYFDHTHFGIEIFIKFSDGLIIEIEIEFETETEAN